MASFADFEKDARRLSTAGKLTPAMLQKLGYTQAQIDRAEALGLIKYGRFGGYMMSETEETPPTIRRRENGRRRLAKRSPSKRKNAALFSELDAAYCADCNAPLKGAGKKQADGRKICAKCARELSKAKVKRSQNTLFGDNSYTPALFNPCKCRGRARRNPECNAETHYKVKSFTVPDHCRKRPAKRAKKAASKKSAKKKAATKEKRPKTERKSRRVPTGNLSLSKFVRRMGGINLKDQELRGEAQALSVKGGLTTGLLNKNSSYNPEYMMDLANEFGYREKDGRPFDHPGNFLGAVASDAHGYEKFYSTAKEWDNPRRRKQRAGRTRRNPLPAGVDLALTLPGAAIAYVDLIKRASKGKRKGTKKAAKRNPQYEVSRRMRDKVKSAEGSSTVSALTHGLAVRKAKKEVKRLGVSPEMFTYTVSKKNPARRRTSLKNASPGVAKIHKSFLGRGLSKARTLKNATSIHTLDKVAVLGRLRRLELANGKVMRFGPRALLAADGRKRLHFLNARSNKKSSRKNPHDTLVIGPVRHIAYETEKDHIGGGQRFVYVHEFGEEGGDLPILKIDGEGFPFLTGGSYQIESRGIVN